MKTKSIVLPLIALMLSAAPVHTFAQPGPGKGMGPGDGERPHRMWEDLNLKEDQKTELKKLHEEMQTVRKKHFEAVKTVRDKIKKELLKNNPSQNVLYGYAGELGELHKQMSKDRGDHLLKVKKILTKEQFTRLLDEKGPMGKGKHGHRRGFKGGRRGGGPRDGSEPGCEHGTGAPQ
jgi:Spy/CpxP family protein refolding chaperone